MISSSIEMFLLVVVSVQFLLVTSSDNWDCADYYWRDYYGVIPEDAVPAGNDSQGNPLYIGLAYIRGYELLPGTIIPDKQVARTTAYALVFDTQEHVQILCSPHKEAFEWISIHSKDLNKYSNRNLIPGGSEVGEHLYLGRVFGDNRVIIGKIFRHERANKGIWFPLKNKPANSLTYEILNYNCDKAFPEIDKRMKIDK